MKTTVAMLLVSTLLVYVPNANAQATCTAECSLSQGLHQAGSSFADVVEKKPRDTCWRTNRSTGQKFRIC
jgi:hypothetical protein